MITAFFSGSFPISLFRTDARAGTAGAAQGTRSGVNITSCRTQPAWSAWPCRAGIRAAHNILSLFRRSRILTLDIQSSAGLFPEWTSCSKLSEATALKMSPFNMVTRGKNDRLSARTDRAARFIFFRRRRVKAL